MKTLKITIEIWRESKFYIARSPELDMVAQGNSLEEAKKNLIEVIEIQFEEMRELGTLNEFLTIFHHPKAKRAIVIPKYKEISIAIIKNNMRTVGMTEEEYLNLLSKI